MHGLNEQRNRYSWMDWIHACLSSRVHPDAMLLESFGCPEVISRIVINFSRINNLLSPCPKKVVL